MLNSLIKATTSSSQQLKFVCSNFTTLQKPLSQTRTAAAATKKSFFSSSARLLSSNSKPTNQNSSTTNAQSRTKNRTAVVDFSWSSSSSSNSHLDKIVNFKERLGLRALNKPKEKQKRTGLLNVQEGFRSSIRMSQTCVNYFAHSFIDRCSDKRKDRKWIEEQLRSEKAVFILFYVDKPFVRVNNFKSTFSLCKLNYSQVRVLLAADSINNNTEQQKQQQPKLPCVTVFLGVEYEKNVEFCCSEDENDIAKRSPYSNPELYSNKDSFSPWFAIDTSGFDSSVENVGKLFADEGEFFEGNFLRMMTIQDTLESSIIAQVK